MSRTLRLLPFSSYAKDPWSYKTLACQESLVTTGRYRLMTRGLTMAKKTRTGITSRSYAAKQDVATRSHKIAAYLGCVSLIIAGLLVFYLRETRIRDLWSNANTDPSRQAKGIVGLQEGWPNDSTFIISVKDDYSIDVRTTSTYALGKNESSLIERDSQGSFGRFLPSTLSYPCSSRAQDIQLDYQNVVALETDIVESNFSKLQRQPKRKLTGDGFIIRAPIGDPVSELNAQMNFYETELRYQLWSPVLENQVVVPLLSYYHDPVKNLSLEFLGRDADKLKDKAKLCYSSRNSAPKEVSLSRFPSQDNIVQLGDIALDHRSHVSLLISTR